MSNWYDFGKSDGRLNQRAESKHNRAMIPLLVHTFPFPRLHFRIPMFSNCWGPSLSPRSAITAVSSVSAHNGSLTAERPEKGRQIGKKTEIECACASRIYRIFKLMLFFVIPRHFKALSTPYVSQFRFPKAHSSRELQRRNEMNKWF